ncbi:MAG: phosphotransferase [Bacteroidales bacterium]|nr:phosphotransferase [Bacteroidales bacterium]
MNTIDLGGHSGCKILLVESGNKNYVRKISSDVSYNERLKKQCEKQVVFSNELIRAPKVYNSGYGKDGLFFFDMEYIHGITLAEYIKTIEIGKISSLVDRILSGFIHMNDGRVGSEADITVFKAKIADLKDKLGKENNSVINIALELLDHHDWSKFTPSACHGDLTMENIIIKNDEIYLIDFLDSFYDCWIIDMGTLLQDVQALWSYRLQNSLGMNTILRLIVFRDLLLEKVEKEKPGYGIEVYYALLQKLLRIFPYTKDQHTYEFLLQKTEMTINMIRKQGDCLCAH